MKCKDMCHSLETFISICCLISGVMTTPSRRPRIIGGQDADIRNFPYQLSMILKMNKQNPQFKGAAVIVSKYAALTSANNIAFIHENLVKTNKVYLRGNVSVWQDNIDSKDHQIIKTTLHPKYTTDSMDYNLAVAKVKEPFTALFEKPITVAKKPYRYRDNETVIISGWGKTSIRQKGPVDSLKFADVRIVNHKWCYDVYAKGYVPRITRRMLCASKMAKDTCVYDSGGPVTHRGVLLALISWGRTCAEDLPGVHTRLPSYHKWLKQTEKSIKFTSK